MKLFQFFRKEKKNAKPFPNPEIPSVDNDGLVVPPWVKYPNIPCGSIGWRMGRGESYLGYFDSAFMKMSQDAQLIIMKKYPEPSDWSGFYVRLKKWDGLK